MDVLTSETCWTLNNEIIKQVTSSLSLFIQLSFYYISVGSSTCFGCWHPSSGAGTAVITASGID